MRRPSLYFLEPSKVGNQHLTLIEGYLAALASSETIGRQYELVLCASGATLAALPQGLKSDFRCEKVPVMDPERRRLVLKTFVELYVVLRNVSRLAENDCLFVSCVLPTTMWLLEKCMRLFPKKRFHAVLHGEIEGLFDSKLQSPSSYGYWSTRWLKSRRPDSRIDLVVLDDFIKEKLISDFPHKFRDRTISVVPHPIIWDDIKQTDTDGPTPIVCFVGYRSRFKGFDEFVRLADDHPGIDFLAIGAGKVENVRSGSTLPVVDNVAYLHELSKCAAAVFPYSGLYTCSLSAAAMDALSVGVQVIAYDRPCFESLAEEFGPDSVLICRSYSDLGATMIKHQLIKNSDKRSERLDRLSRSKYSIASVSISFERLLDSIPIELSATKGEQRIEL